MAKLREKGLHEIFDFYCKQHLVTGNRMTFDDIEKEGAKLNIGDYMKLCQDFEINVKRETLNEIYRLRVKRSKATLEINTFKECLSDVFKHLDIERRKQRKKDIEALKA